MSGIQKLFLFFSSVFLLGACSDVQFKRKRAASSEKSDVTETTEVQIGSLASQVVDQGNPALFMLTGVEVENPSYTWSKDGQPLPGQQGQFIMFPVAELTDAGTYAVQVYSNGAYVGERSATLTVNQVVPEYRISKGIHFETRIRNGLALNQKAGDSRKWTTSGWVRRPESGEAMHFLARYPAYSNSDIFRISVDTQGRVDMVQTEGDCSIYRLETTNTVPLPGANPKPAKRAIAGFGGLEIDPVDQHPASGPSPSLPRFAGLNNDWHHVVVAYDSAQPAAEDRVRIYIDGVESSLQRIRGVACGAGAFMPPRNKPSWLNVAGKRMYVGADPTSVDRQSGGHLGGGGDLADFHLIDGQALPADRFGRFDEQGEWVPIKYEGEFGPNGMRLDFNDADDLGADVSGNGNHTNEMLIDASNQVQDGPF